MFRLLCNIGALALILLFSISMVIGGTQFINRDNYLCIQGQTHSFDTTNSGQLRQERVTIRFDTSSRQLWKYPIISFSTPCDECGEFFDAEYLKTLTDKTKKLTSPEGTHFALITNDHLVITNQRGQVDSSIPISPDYSLFSWSPQGEYLTLIHDVHIGNERYDFEVVNLRTHRLYDVSGATVKSARAAPAGTLARWSNNGQFWLFEHHLGAERSLMKLDVDTGSVSALTSSDLIQSVVFSPTGQYVAIVRQLPEKDQVVDVIDIDNGSVKRLVNPTRNGMLPSPYYSGVFTVPHWTPDGQFVAVGWGWTSEYGHAAIGFPPDYPIRDYGGLAWMHPDGSGQGEVGGDISSGVTNTVLQDLPMPYGTWLAYSTITQPHPMILLNAPYSSLGINIVNLQTGSNYVLVDNLVQNEEGAVYPSPDGQVFVVANVSATFKYDRRENTKTLTMVTLGRSPTISYYARWFEVVGWSPNNSMFAFVNDEGMLYVLRRDGMEILHHDFGTNKSIESPNWTQCM